MNHITIIAGARPNFMKVAPIIHEIKRQNAAGMDIHYSLVPGQHYDKKMSGDFFEQLNIPEPDATLVQAVAPRLSKLERPRFALKST